LEPPVEEIVKMASCDRMAKLSDRIENVLNEARMLLLGGQVLLGFSYRVFFEPGFDRITDSARIAQLAGVGIMTVSLGLLIWPASFHQIAESGRPSQAVETFTTSVLDWALLPLALGLALILYPVADALRLPGAAWIGGAGGLLAMTFWYGGVLTPRDPKNCQHGQGSRLEQCAPDDASNLSERIKKALIECRMALPGAQAFLGFQFAIVFAERFNDLPRSSQLIHFGSLVATTITIVLLIAPAAYHRLVEAGQDTERFHRVASRLLLAALVFLAPGMAGDLFVVIRKLTASEYLAGTISAALLLTFYVLWFGVTLWKRQRRPQNKLL
jgi:hypothetical protein